MVGRSFKPILGSSGGVNTATGRPSLRTSVSRSVRSHSERFAGSVEMRISSIQQAVAEAEFDDILISTLPAKRSRWLRTDLLTEVRKLGLPVAVFTPPEEAKMGLKDLPTMTGPG